MISDNSLIAFASANFNDEKLDDLDFKYFSPYAKYLLENKLDEFVKAQLKLSREIKLPLLKLLDNLTEEKLIETGLINTKELLSCCAVNKANDYIKISVERWLKNQLPFISKSQIVAEDISSFSFIRRTILRQFIKFYTNDSVLYENILNEIDLFTTRADAEAIKAFFEMQQQLFSQAQSLSHIGNWQWDLKTKKLFWSDEIYRIYELEAQSSILSEKIRIYNHPDDMDIVDHYMSLLVQTLKPQNFSYRIILKDDRQKTLHVKSQVKLDDKGMPTEMYGTLQDVTEQKQNERALEESKKFAEKIADVSPCIITAYNVNTGDYIFLNKGLQTLLGYNLNDFYNNGRKFFYELVHADDVAHLKEKTSTAVLEANSKDNIGAEQIVEFKYRLKHKDGSYRWIHTFTTVFNRDANNNVQDMLNVSMDITESNMLTLQLAQMNEEIKYKELQHQRMISEVEDYAIILMDEEGFIKNWNKGAEKIKGYTSSEIIGRNFRIFYRQEDRDRKLPEFLINEAIEKGKASHEGWRLRKDGTSFWGSIVITALHDDDNNLIGFSKVTRNLTERKLAEDKLREYARHIEIHNEELRRINKDLDSFTYMASHDLQEPLRKIRTFSNIILSKAQENLSAEISGYFERIINSVNRMQTLIDSLLNYSRATTSEIVLEPTSLNTVIEEVKNELAEVIEEKQVTIICGKLPVLKIERLQFHQLFFNLFENAIKYRREDVLPEIRIDASTFWKEVNNEEKAQFHSITVKDNGIGFEQQYADNIFKLFQRLHGRSEYSGTGIGLAICKKIVENHKGTISALGEPGKGSTFVIEIPVDNPEDIT